MVCPIWADTGLIKTDWRCGVSHLMQVLSLMHRAIVTYITLIWSCNLKRDQGKESECSNSSSLQSLWQINILHTPHSHLLSSVASPACAEASLTLARGSNRSGPPSWPSVNLNSGGEKPSTSNDISAANVWSLVALGSVSPL